MSLVCWICAGVIALVVIALIVRRCGRRDCHK